MTTDAKPDDLQEQLAAFAAETGVTIIEWLEMWRANEVNATEAAEVLTERAIGLERRLQVAP